MLDILDKAEARKLMERLCMSHKGKTQSVEKWLKKTKTGFDKIDKLSIPAYEVLNGFLRIYTGFKKFISKFPVYAIDEDSKFNEKLVNFFEDFKSHIVDIVFFKEGLLALLLVE